MLSIYPLPSQVGPYRIVRKLGEGGMGVVYEGVHTAIARRVAIKVLRGEAVGVAGSSERFFNEARAVNLIEHSSLVQISDFGRAADGCPYLVMELLRGESLAARLLRGPVTTMTAVQIGWQIADALVAVHAQGIVHRDLKPDNLMLVPDPVAPGGERVKILDFGIAKLQPTGGSRTHSNVIMGTPAYMSPEQCKGAGQVDARSDSYTLGIILFELCAGRPPFVGEMGELIAQHLFSAPPALSALVPQCPPALSVLIESLLLKDRSLRPAMTQVRAGLAQLLAAGDSGIHSTVITQSGLLSRTHLRKRMIAMASGCALVAAGWAGYSLWARFQARSQLVPASIAQSPRERPPASPPPPAPLIAEADHHSVAEPNPKPLAENASPKTESAKPVRSTTNASVKHKVGPAGTQRPAPSAVHAGGFTDVD